MTTSQAYIAKATDCEARAAIATDLRVIACLRANAADYRRMAQVTADRTGPVVPSPRQTPVYRVHGSATTEGLIAYLACVAKYPERNAQLIADIRDELEHRGVEFCWTCEQPEVAGHRCPPITKERLDAAFAAVSAQASPDAFDRDYFVGPDGFDRDEEGNEV